jgi:hypothetical protein
VDGWVGQREQKTQNKKQKGVRGVSSFAKDAAGKHADEGLGSGEVPGGADDGPGSGEVPGGAGGAQASAQIDYLCAADLATLTPTPPPGLS